MLVLNKPPSITDTRLHWPEWSDLVNTLSLQEYNTQIVVIGTTLLGMSAGLIGTFAYLRKRSMMGDALSHATLPGIAAAFIITQKKDLGYLLLGATLTGVLGVCTVLGLRRFSRIKEDAAIGIVLSVFFGCGAVLMSLIQSMATGQEAGLGSFIYGKAAAMQRQDAQLIALLAGGVMLGSILLFKEFRIVCFDPQYAAAQGWPVLLIDLFMMGLVVITTVIGLQAVGLILIIALLIIPAAAARFWTDGLTRMAVLAALFGTLSGWLGSTFSALLPRLPAGAIIVIVAGALFFFSMLFAPHRGVLASVLRQRQLRRKISYQHLLRAMAEHEEQNSPDISASFEALLALRSWSRTSLLRLLARASSRGDMMRRSKDLFSLTTRGRIEAERVLRNHRLWETYLIQYADIAPSHVDRDADEVEHILSEELIRELEAVLAHTHPIPPSPHAAGGLP